MRAAVVTECGQPPVAAARPKPVAGPGEVLVRVIAAAITPLDLLCASGISYFGAPAVPYVPGVQGVGALGDRTLVWFPTTAGMRPGDGSMATFAAVPVADLVELPTGVDPELVAALGLSAVAASRALRWRGALAHGETVLVLGAGGVVGQAAIQLAHLHGAGRVVAACRSDAARQRARAAGADAVVALHDDDAVPDLAGRLRDAAGGAVDLVVDPLFGVPAAAALRALRPGGRLVNLGSSAAETAPIDSATLRSGSLRVLGYTNNELTGEQRAETLREIAAHARSGALRVDWERVPLEEVSTAWSRQAAGVASGRIVLAPEG
jgi:NADPH:quinone reductase